MCQPLPDIASTHLRLRSGHNTRQSISEMSDVCIGTSICENLFEFVRIEMLKCERACCVVCVYVGCQNSREMFMNRKRYKDGCGSIDTCLCVYVCAGACVYACVNVCVRACMCV